MNVKIFGKKGCAKCETTKNKITHFIKRWDIAEKVKLSFYDLDTTDGMAEGAYSDVGEIPTVIIEKNDTQLARWDGEVPKSKEFQPYLIQEN